MADFLMSEVMKYIQNVIWDNKKISCCFEDIFPDLRIYGLVRKREILKCCHYSAAAHSSTQEAHRF